MTTTWIVHRDAPPDNLQNHRPRFIEFTVQKLTPAGELIWELSVNELLRDQGLQGLLYLSTLEDLRVVVRGDTLHLNDVDVFPETLPEGVFRHGDIMLSLRNINTVMVIDPVDFKIRWISTGKVLRQHDPAFIDGNTISIFDNNNLLDDYFDNASGKRGAQGQSSRIVTLSAADDEVAVVKYDGAPDNTFFTDAMGSHQWLPNGNLLVIEARAGRVFEVAPDGTLLWELFNVIGPELLGAINDAMRLDTRFDRAFFERIGSDCSTSG